jgi:hypothetical protein
VGHFREVDECRRRIEVLRPYFKRARGFGLPSIRIEPNQKKAAKGSEILFPVRKVRKWGYKNSESKMVIDFAYQEAQPFCEDLAWVRLDERWIALTPEGKAAIELDVESVERVWPFEQGLARFRHGRMQEVYNYEDERPVLERLFVGYYNFVDRQGNLMRAVKGEDEFVRAENFRGPYAWVQDKQSRRGWINTKAEWVEEDEIRKWRVQTGDWAVAGSVLDGFRYVDADGDTMLEVPKGPDSVRPFHDGLAAIWVQGKGTGYIDREGNTVVPPQYAYGQDFSEGYAAVCPEAALGLWTYIDTQGRPIAAPEFSEAQPFRGGLAMVKKNLHYYLDTQGRLVVPPDME